MFSFFSNKIISVNYRHYGITFASSSLGIPLLCGAAAQAMFWASKFIKRKSLLAVVVVVFLKGTRDPLTHVIADFRISIETRVLIHVQVSAYDSLVFSDRVVDKCLMNIWHSLPMPPFVPNTSGVKTPCSISTTLWKYSLSLLASWLLNIQVVIFSRPGLRSWRAWLLCRKMPSVSSARIHLP